MCFHYIHQNPVNAGLVKKATDWEFSSVPRLCRFQEREVGE